MPSGRTKNGARASDFFRIPANRGFAGECVKTRHIVCVPDAYADPRFNPDIDKSTGYKTRCILTIPPSSASMFTSESFAA